MQTNAHGSVVGQDLSDLMDGFGDSEMDAQRIDKLLADPGSIDTWHAYHVVGDVLRSPELAPTQSDLAFLQRFEERLAHEPQRPATVEADSAPVLMAAESANAAVFRWKVLAGMACTALLGVMVLWHSPMVGPQDGAQMAALSKAPTTNLAADIASADAGPMIRDARLDELMAAHRQLGGHSALQVPAGFLRNATFEGPGR